MKGKKSREVIGRFEHFCEKCGHSQMVKIWRGRKSWNCSVCRHRNNLLDEAYYLWEFGHKVGG